jgi:hypothetical protein
MVTEVAAKATLNAAFPTSRMEPLRSPAVAIGGKWSQIRQPRKPQKQAKTVAVGCSRLPEGAHGKEGVDGSSPSEGSKSPANQVFVLSGLNRR